jgi:CubicO group peptidase (beta-lactamase class C family)
MHMNAGARTTLAAAAWFLTWACTESFGQPPQKQEIALPVKLDSLLNDIQFSGTVLIKRDGKVIFSKGYQGADADTLFEIASLSKQFTAMAVLLAEHEGLLSVDDSIVDHLPGVPAAFHEQWKPVSIDHLLQHTGGVQPGGIANAADLREAVQLILNRKPQFPPGSKGQYSNAGYALLAGIVETTTGKPFQEYCRTRIFEPAGMKSTGFCGEDFPEDRLAKGFNHRWAILRPANIDPYPPYEKCGFEYLGMGGIVTTANDLSRWHDWLKNDAVPQAIKRRGFSDESDRPKKAYGWEQFHLTTGQLCRGHGGEVSGFRCKLWWFPEDQDTLLILLSNRDDFEWSNLHAISQLLFPPAQP